MSDPRPHESEDPVLLAELEQAKAGDRDAVSAVLSRLESAFGRQAKRELGDDLGARLRGSDLVQSAFLQVIRGLAGFEGRSVGEFHSWAGSILRTQALKLRRHHGAAKRSEPTEEQERERLAQTLNPAPVPTPSGILRSQESVDAFKSALETLTDEQREVILLSVFEGLSRGAVAERIGRTEGATRQLLFRARAAFALALDEDGPAARD